MKKIITIILIFILSFTSVNSLKIFEIDETEKLSLDLKTDDPDEDILTYSYTGPLNEYGEWQTTYGDAGEYSATITVSDGESDVSEEILIIVNRKEEAPKIDSFAPLDNSLNIEEGEKIKFKVDVSDLNNDELEYEWSVNEEFISDINEMIFETNFDDSGDYEISVVIGDGTSELNKVWFVHVTNVDLEGIIDQIEDVIIIESETASINLPNLEKYGISFDISGPLGNQNEWITNLEDEGEYLVKITAEGKGFRRITQVKIIVNNLDRAPELIGLVNTQVIENEKLEIVLNAIDPDGDSIILSVQDMPEGAKFEGNVFSWTPSFDFVQKNNFFDYVRDSFRFLERSVNVVFVAQSNDLFDMEEIKIKVFDKNRPFTLKGLDDIEVNEGDVIYLEPYYEDPDRDRVTFSYSGFMNGKKKRLGFDDSGEYVVKVVAKDPFHTQTKFINIIVNDVNRKPKFNSIRNVEVNEGDKVRIELSASDPDNDAISFSMDNSSIGRLNDNLFVWKPGFDVVSGTEKEFNVEFVVSDGVEEDVQKVKITVINVNQAPKVVSFSNNLIVTKDEPVLFEINAVDLDGDELTYNWNFGFFGKYEGENQHQRIFTSTGSKKVEVVISDGLESVSKVWNVEVV